MEVKYPIPPTPSGFEQLTVSSTSVEAGLASIPTNARYALIRVLDDDVRIRMDGTAVTSLVGFPLRFDDARWLELTSRKQLDDFKVIRDTLSSENATLYVMYYQLT